jgi:hypothetical protein
MLQTTMIPRTYYASLLVLLSLVAAADSTRLAFHFDGASHAGCKSSAYNVEIGAMKFTCDNGEDLCRPGDKAILEGWSKCRSCHGVTPFGGSAIDSLSSHHHHPSISCIN